MRWQNRPESAVTVMTVPGNPVQEEKIQLGQGCKFSGTLIALIRAPFTIRLKSILALKANGQHIQTKTFGPQPPTDAGRFIQI
jgi:hypothetical protein